MIICFILSVAPILTLFSAYFQPYHEVGEKFGATWFIYLFYFSNLGTVPQNLYPFLTF